MDFREHISDAAIQLEMGAPGTVINFAIAKQLVYARHRFEGWPNTCTATPCRPCSKTRRVVG
jgi:hypothetical protein